LGEPVVVSTLIYIGFVLFVNIASGVAHASRANNWSDQPEGFTAIAEIAAWSRHLLMDFGLALAVAPSLLVAFGFLPDRRRI
jgi:hypothetical protein